MCMIDDILRIFICSFHVFQHNVIFHATLEYLYSSFILFSRLNKEKFTLNFEMAP